MAENKGIGQHSKFDYLSAITMAKNTPKESSSGGKAVGLPAIFETIEEAEQRESSYVEKKVDPAKLGVETYLDANSMVFLIYRPWEKCNRCKEAINNGEVVLPTVCGDYTCPHTQIKEYLAVLNAGLKGDILITTKEQISTPDGLQRVHLEWLAPNEDKKQEIKRKLQKNQNNNIYPPNIKSIFND